MQRQPLDVLGKDIAEGQAYVQRVSAQRELHFFLSHFGDSQHDAWKAISVSPDQRPEQVNRKGWSKAETQRAARQVLNIADCAAANLQLTQRSPHMAQVGFAHISGTHSPAAAIEQLPPFALRARGSAGTAPSTCQCGSARCKRLAVGIGDLLATRAEDFRPDLKCLGPGSSTLGGSDMIAAEVEQVIDLIVG